MCCSAASLQLSNFPFFQVNDCSLASLICEGCGLQGKRTIGNGKQVLYKQKPVFYNTMGRIFIHDCVKPCRLPFEKHCIGPKICLRSNLMASTFQNFSGGVRPFICTSVVLTLHKMSYKLWSVTTASYFNSVL